MRHPLRKAAYLQRLDSFPSELALQLESIEAEVWLDWLAAAPPGRAESLGISWFRVAGAVAGMARNTHILMYNRVVGLGMSEPATHEHVDELIARYTHGAVPRWMIQWSPNARPSGIVDFLRACGFQHYNNWAKLYRAADAALTEPRTPFRIERVGGDSRDAFADILCAAFDHDRELAEWNASLVDRPGWRAYMAFDGDIPIATGALFVHGHTGWIGFGATRAEYRGRGAQSALVAVRIRTAAELGCETVVAETAEDRAEKPSQSFRNLTRLGFRMAYLRPNYVMVTGTRAAGLVAERPSIF